MIRTYGSGTFVKDPILQEVGGTVKTSFTLVYNEKFTKANGERVSVPHYLDFEAWDSAARHIVENCRKGDKIWVEAHPKQERWEKDGQKRQRIVFRIDRFDIFQYEEDEPVYEENGSYT